MNQHFAALFVGLRQKLALESSLSNVELNNIEGSGGLMNDFVAQDNTYTNDLHEGPETEFLLHNHRTFLDQQIIRQNEYNRVVENLDSRAKQLEKHHFAVKQMLKTYHHMAMGRINSIQSYCKAVIQTRRRQDDHMLLQAQKKLQLLLQQCLGEISKETNRLRDHNHIQFETLSAANIAIQQRVQIQKVLTLLAHELGDNIQINNIGIIAHAKGSHLSGYHQQPKIRSVAKMGTETQDGSHKNEDEKEATQGGKSRSIGDDILLQWHADVRYKDSRDLIKELLNSFFQSQLRNSLCSYDARTMPAIVPEFFGVTQIVKNVIVKRNVKKMSNSVKNKRYSSENNNNDSASKFDGFSSAASRILNKHRQSAPNNHNGNDTASIAVGLQWKSCDNVESLIDELNLTLKNITNNSDDVLQSRKAGKSKACFFPATMALSTSCFCWCLPAGVNLNSFVFYRIDDRRAFKTNKTVEPASTQAPTISDQSDCDWMSEKNRNASNIRARVLEEYLYSEYCVSKNSSIDAEVGSKQAPYVVQKSHEGVKFASQESENATQLPTLYEAGPACNGTSIGMATFAVASIRQLLHCLPIKRYLANSCDSKQYDRLSHIYGPLFGGARSISLDEEHCPEDASCYSNLYVLLSPASDLQNRHFVPLRPTMYAELCRYYVRISLTEPVSVNNANEAFPCSTNITIASQSRPLAFVQECAAFSKINAPHNFATSNVPSFFVTTACHAHLSEAMTIADNAALHAQASRNPDRWVGGVVGSGPCGLTECEGQVTTGSKPSNDTFSGRSNRRSNNHINSQRTSSSLRNRQLLATAALLRNQQQCGNGEKHFNSAKRAVAAKASASRRAKLSLGERRKEDYKSQATKVVLKKHVYILHRIDIGDIIKRDHHKKVENSAVVQVEAIGDAHVHHANAVIGKSNNTDDEDDDEYSLDDFDNDERRDSAPSVLSSSNADTRSYPQPHDTQEGTNALMDKKIENRPREYCAWLGCTQSVIDAIHPADISSLQSMSISYEQTKHTKITENTTPLLLCRLHARNYKALVSKSNGAKELRKYLRDFYNPNNKNRRDGRKNSKTKQRQIDPEVNHVDIQVQRGGLGAGSPLLRELKDSKLQSTIYSFWKRLGQNIRKNALAQVQNLCLTASKEWQTDEYEDRLRAGKISQLSLRIEQQVESRTLAEAEAKEFGKLSQIEHKITKLLQSAMQLCAQSDVFIDKRELSQLFDAEASRFQARKEQTSGEAALSKKTARILHLHYEVESAKRKLQIASNVRDHVLEAVASRGVRANVTAQRQLSMSLGTGGSTSTVFAGHTKAHSVNSKELNGLYSPAPVSNKPVSVLASTLMSTYGGHMDKIRTSSKLLSRKGNHTSNSNVHRNLKESPFRSNHSKGRRR